MIDIAIERFLLVVVVAAAQWLVGRNSGKTSELKRQKAKHPFIKERKTITGINRKL
jgi:hypothetical protein